MKGEFQDHLATKEMMEIMHREQAARLNALAIINYVLNECEAPGEIIEACAELKAYHNFD